MTLANGTRTASAVQKRAVQPDQPPTTRTLKEEAPKS